MPFTQAQVTKEDTPALRQMANKLVGKLSALVPHLHTLHQDVTGSHAPTDAPTDAPPSTVAQVQAVPVATPSIYDSLFTAHAIVNRIEDCLASLRSKV